MAPANSCTMEEAQLSSDILSRSVESISSLKIASPCELAR